ncbi:hypothetical protein [Lujinxingia vulgaris]|uniref:hypothetical protein n=1 Tax=Lujinxingia vulgaris TaxID=2600176 RepID=UPI001E5AF786|nr:hypothetical protein [Lujinxingia vulgaris]
MDISTFTKRLRDLWCLSKRRAQVYHVARQGHNHPGEDAGSIAQHRQPRELLALVL